MSTKIRNPLRGPSGEILIEEISVPLPLLKITLWDGEGNARTGPWDGEVAAAMVLSGSRQAVDDVRSFRFKAEGPGIDSDRVIRVRLPVLDYERDERLVAIVSMFVEGPTRE